MSVPFNEAEDRTQETLDGPLLGCMNVKSYKFHFNVEIRSRFSLLRTESRDVAYLFDE